MTKLSILAIAAMAIGGLIAGCSAPAETPETPKTEPITKAEDNTATPVAFSNDKGEALCPVMGDVVADTASAKYQDYEGKRYYFCCGDCPEKFKADPAKYADGKALPPAEPTEHKEGSM